ncbi:uncharacterized protein J3R85_006256 [Psidium guajava]|nr:uncharacterized protein J3R85_006256 [Psidium guajava]
MDDGPDDLVPSIAVTSAVLATRGRLLEANRGWSYRSMISEMAGSPRLQELS